MLDFFSSHCKDIRDEKCWIQPNVISVKNGENENGGRGSSITTIFSSLKLTGFISMESEQVCV